MWSCCRFEPPILYACLFLCRDKITNPLSCTKVKTARFSFSFLFPLLELLIWLFLVAVPSTLTYLNLRSTPKHSGSVDVTVDGITFSLSSQEMRHIALEGPATRVSHALTALNMPAMVVEILTSLPTSWPDSWHPKNLSVDAWRSIAFPFYCLPAWWFVGRGFDALRRRERLGIGSTLISALFSILFMVLLCGLSFAVSTERDDTAWPLVGLALWAVLFASLPLAWFKARRVG